jgi:hypothetical protein
MGTIENDLKRAVIQYLTYKGCFAWSNNTGAYSAEYQGKTRRIRFGFPGSSDVLGITPDGRLIAVEAKTEQGKLRDNQRDFLQQVAARGGIALCVRPSDYTRLIDEALEG